MSVSSLLRRLPAPFELVLARQEQKQRSNFIVTNKISPFLLLHDLFL